MGIVDREEFVAVVAQDFHLKEISTEDAASGLIRVNSSLVRNDGPNRKLRKDPHIDQSLVIALDEGDMWVEIPQMLPVELLEDFDMFNFLNSENISVHDLCDSPGDLARSN